jgi:hypothetical protein
MENVVVDEKSLRKRKEKKLLRRINLGKHCDKRVKSKRREWA